MSGVFGEGFIKVRPDTAGFSHEAKEGVVGPIKEIAKLAAGALVIGGGVEFLKGAVEKAAQAARAEDTLKVSLENQHVSWLKNKEAIDEYTHSASKATAFHTTDITNSLARLFTATGSVAKAEKDESIAANIARLKHIDLAAATNLVVGATAGNTRALRQMGIIMSPVTDAQDKLKTSVSQVKDNLAKQELAYKDTAKTQKLSSGVVAEHILKLKEAAKAQIDEIKAGKPAAAVADKQATGVKLLDELKRRASGQAQEYAKSEEGAVDRLKNSFDQVQITIGKVLLPVIAQLASSGADYVDKFVAAFPKLKQQITDAIAPAKPLFDGIKASIQGVNNLLGGTGNTLKDIGIAVAAFVVISKTIQVATLAYQALTTAIFLARNAQVALDVAMESNPVGIVVVALVALGAALYVAYTRSATFRAIVNGAFDALKTVAIPALNAVKTAVGDFVTWLQQHWSRIKAILLPIITVEFAAVKGYIMVQVVEIEKIFDLFGDLLHGRWSKIWGDLKALVTAPLNQVKSTVSSILNTIEDASGTNAAGIAHAIANGIKKAPGFLAGLAGDLASKVRSAVESVAGQAAGWALDVGSAIVRGIGQGIRDGAGHLGDVASSIAHSALKKATFGLANALVQFSSDVVGQLQANTATLGTALTRSLVSQVTQAVQAAKTSLVSLSGGIATSINSIIDAATTQAIAKIPANISAAIQGFKGGTIADATGKIAKDQSDRQQRNLEQALTAAKAAHDAAVKAVAPTVDQKTGRPIPQADIDKANADIVQARIDTNQALGDAQVDLDDFLLQQQINTDTATYNEKVKSAQDAATLAKNGVTDQIDLWTRQYNTGVISQQTYLDDINGLVNTWATGDGSTAWGQAGDLLGTAFVAGFQGQLQTLIAQVTAITQSGQLVGGNGSLGNVTNPSDSVVSQLSDAMKTVTGDEGDIAAAKAAITKANSTYDAAVKRDKADAKKLANDADVYTKQLAAANKQLDAANASEKKDKLVVGALRAILTKSGINPDQAIADAGR